jgi:hypothetical protein
VKIHLTFDERPRDLYNLWLMVDRSKEIRSLTAEKCIPVLKTGMLSQHYLAGNDTGSERIQSENL